MARKKKGASEESDPLLSVVDAIQRKYGASALSSMSVGSREKYDVIPTGSVELDAATGVGGWPRGRIIELFGQESSGKTTLSLHAVVEAQRLGLQAAYIDVEHALDKKYARNIGVDLDSMMFAQPDSGEQALDISDMLVRSGAFGVVVIDSVAALVPQAELDGSIGDSHIGLQARLMGQTLRKLKGSASAGNTLLIFINQLRAKIGGLGFGPKNTTTGGNSLKFFASLRCDIRRIGSVKQGDKIVASETLVKIVKNKVAPPFEEARFEISFGVGIDRAAGALDKALEQGIVEKNGAWFTYGDTQLGQGREKAKEFLRANPELLEELLKPRGC